MIPANWGVNDGCTMWFDNWFGVVTTKCCEVHDAAYANGTSFTEFFTANFDLLVCGMNLNAPMWAILGFCGVSIGGAIPFFFGNKEVKVITVYDPAQGNNSLRNGEGPREVSSPSETVRQERK